MHAHTVFRHAVSFASTLLLLTGCSTTGKEVASPRTIPVESMISSAESAMAAGDRQNALSLLDAANKAHPTSPQPWLKKARIFFDAGNYPSAILAAEEALQRDSINAEAGSIALVSSLRIAVKYVSDLRVQAELTGDARPDGERLAAMLRETLNEPVLIPADNRQPPPIAPRSARPAQKARYASPKPLPSESGSSNPFSSLK